MSGAAILQSNRPDAANRAFSLQKEKMEFELGKGVYRIIHTPKLKFNTIKKERGTRGRMYAVWNNYDTVFLSQSMPALMKMITLLTRCKPHASSFYRILRAEQKTQCANGLQVCELQSVHELNKFLERFDTMFVCSMDLFGWEVDPDSIQSVSQ